MTRGWKWFGMLPLALAGCPGGGDDETGDDEIGDESDSTTETGDPDPIDPLEDTGQDPPGEPDTEATWLSPTTLGNGLVHDTRYLLGTNYDIADEISALTSELGDGVPWDLTDHQTMLQVGFRPSQVHAEISMSAYNGTVTKVAIEDNSVYISDDDANYLHRVETYIFADPMEEQAADDFGPEIAGFRPVSIDVVNIERDEVVGPPTSWVGFTIAWVYDESEIPWQIITPQLKSTFTSGLGDLFENGWRPAHLDVEPASRSRRRDRWHLRPRLHGIWRRLDGDDLGCFGPPMACCP